MISLKANIFTHAKLFIEDMGEFAPFAAKMIDGNIKDIVFYNDENEILDTQKTIKTFQDIFRKDFNENSAIEAAAFVYDVSANFKNADGVSEKRDTLCLRISTDGENWSEEYFPYLIINGECVWM